MASIDEIRQGITPAATIDDGSGTADYAQPGAVPLTKEITKRGKASPAPTMASKGIAVARDKFGVDEIAGSGGGVSMPKTPMTASAVNPTARIMSPGDLVSEAINRMPLGVRRKDQPAMLAAIMHGMTAANNAMAHAGSEFARADLAAQTGMADAHSDLAANVHAAGINKDLGIMKNESDMAQLSETKRHNRAAEGINWYEAKHKNDGSNDGTTLSKNIDQLVKSGIAKDAKDAWKLLNGKKGGRDDFVSRVVEQGIATAAKNFEQADVDSLVTSANAAADKLFGSREEAAPQAPNRFDGAVLFPQAQQGITVQTPTTNMVRESGIKAKRPSITSFYQ